MCQQELVGNECMQGRLCVIGRFGDLGYTRSKLVEELCAALPDGVFPWSEFEIAFTPESNDVAYFWDASFEAIARGYLRSMNLGGLRALMTVTYGLDTFTAPDGLYGKVLLNVPQDIDAPARLDWVSRVLAVLAQHQYISEGGKVSFDLLTKQALRDPSMLEGMRTLWMRATAQHSADYGNVTQHIYIGERGAVAENDKTRKSHIFRRAGETPTYETGRPQDQAPSEVAPFVQIASVVVREGLTHSIHVRPSDVEPNMRPTVEKGE
jgi:hypothetical protein